LESKIYKKSFGLEMQKIQGKRVKEKRKRVKEKG
jgi:hypothetical protein